MAQQTAVDWLIHNIVKDKSIKPISINEFIAIFQQAKQMEKEQIINTYLSACARVTPYGNYTDSAEQYYNETYNK